MVEHALNLGESSHLVGVLNEPAELAPEAPLVILLNAGLVHHVGPNRLNVDLARSLASTGYRSLRFDLAGIGDSDRSAEERDYRDQALLDIAQAMDYMESRDGTDRFVLIGLCTGAYNALAAASDDERVTGAVLIDGYAFPTLRYEVSEKARKLTQGWRWRRYLKRRFGRVEQSKQASPYDALVFEPYEMGKDEYSTTMNRLLGRNVEVFLVFTGHGPQPYNYTGQFLDVFPQYADADIRVEYIPDATHTFTRKDHRDHLTASVRDWMARFAPMADAAPTERTN